MTDKQCCLSVLSSTQLQYILHDIKMWEQITIEQQIKVDLETFQFRYIHSTMFVVCKSKFLFLNVQVLSQYESFPSIYAQAYGHLFCCLLLLLANML